MKGLARSAAPALALLALLTTLPTASPAAAPGLLTPVTVGSTARISNAPLFIAGEEGYFAQWGLDVRLVEIRESSQAWPALIAGQLDAYAGAINAGLMEAIMRGARLRIVADKGYIGPGDRSSAVMVRQDLIASGRFRTLRDLRGMRIGAGTRTSVGGLFLLRVLRDRALITEQDVTLQMVPLVALPDAFRARALDAALVSEPFVTRLEVLGLAKVVIGMFDVLPRAQYAAITYGPNLLARNPGVGQRLMNGYLRGVQQYLEGKTPRNVALIQKFTGDDEDLVRRMQWPYVQRDGHVNVESVMQIQSWWVREGFLGKALPAERWYDPSFARRAVRTLAGAR